MGTRKSAFQKRLYYLPQEIKVSRGVGSLTYVSKLFSYSKISEGIQDCLIQ